MAIKSMIRLNQIKDQGSELQAHRQTDLGGNYSAFNSTDGQDGLEATLAQLQDGLHHRFGSDAMGANGLFDGVGSRIIEGYGDSSTLRSTISANCFDR